LTHSMTMDPQCFVVCNHSCPHSKSAMMKSNRANALKLCYVFPYPPAGGIKNHLTSPSFHPLCSDACDARQGPEFIDAGTGHQELQYWLPMLLLHSICPPGYNTCSMPQNMPMPGLWTEGDGNGVKGKYMATFYQSN